MPENTKSKTILIALGANLGKPERAIAAAEASLAKMGIAEGRMSALWRSPAWPDPDAQPDYVNAVLAARTTLSPDAVMAGLHGIEREAGRVRGARNAARALDLDLIDYAGEVRTGRLTLPHPRMQGRGFVLFPLAEVAPDWVHPISGLSVAELIARLPLADVAPMNRIGHRIGRLRQVG